jgi:hypothetical protein
MLDIIEDLPDIQGIITEDDTPVDNLPSEKQQRLLTEPLYSAWPGPGEDRPFLAAANVGVFSMVRTPPVVPDMFLSLDVEVAGDWWQKAHRSYFLWEFGKAPDLVLEIVSNQEGGEDGEKRLKYQRMRVPYYVIYDPLRQVMAEPLTVYRLVDAVYERQDTRSIPLVGLGLTLWDGVFEGKQETWLRWTDAEGVLIPTGKELAEQERQKAGQERQKAAEERQKAAEERQRAEQERHKAEQAQQRADQAERLLAEEQRRVEALLAKLREAGLDPS